MSLPVGDKVRKRPATVVRASSKASSRLRGTSRVNLAEHAYDRLEELIVSCALRPGLFLSIPELQERLGLGRTPTHQAVSRLAADTLVTIRPRHGLQIAPIDLARERTLLQLRRDLERFVVRLATERASAAHRNQLRHIGVLLEGGPGPMPINEFNLLDCRIDRLSSPRPARRSSRRPCARCTTIFRRIGWIYHNAIRPNEGLDRTLECHLAILDGVVAGRAKEAMAASDRLVRFNDAMLKALGGGVDRALLDCSLEDRDFPTADLP